MNDYPNLLIIASNPFSHNQNNSKTLSYFFDGWPKDKIAQIYFTLDSFENDVCENYFRITDLDILNKVIKRKDTTKSFYKQHIDLTEKNEVHKNVVYMFIRYLFIKKCMIVKTFKNIFWSLANPSQIKRLNNWIENFKPNVIFFQSGDDYVLIEFVKKLSLKYNIPICLCVFDDFTNIDLSFNPFYYIDKIKYLNKFKEIIKLSKCNFVISEKMKDEYSIKYGGKYEIARNNIDISSNKIIDYDKIKNNPLVITYAGNLDLGRWKVLYKIGKALEIINKKMGMRYVKLDIFSKNANMISKRSLSKLNMNSTMEFKGNINNEELIAKRNNSDLLLHVESFEKKYSKRVKLSFSTKIPECLVSRRCILAVGPKNVASINYITYNEIGFVVNSLKMSDLVFGLEKAISNKHDRLKYIQNGEKLIDTQFSYDKNKEKIQKIVCELY